MERPTPTFDWDALDAAVREHERRAAAASTPPPGTFTTAMYREHHRIAKSTAERRVRRLLDRGIIERAGTFVVQTRTGTVKSALYRLKGKP